MAFSSRDLKLIKACYWIIFIMIHLYICYLLFATSRAIAGIMWLIFGFILLFIMYPVYFPFGDPGAQWPPYVSACPDYLTMIRPGACVDFVGLGSQLSKSDPSLPPASGDASRVFDSSGSLSQKAARSQQFDLSWEGVT